MTEAERIVRKLAAVMPVVWGDECMHWCGVCGKALAMDSEPDTHESDCVYADALRWVANQNADRMNFGTPS